MNKEEKSKSEEEEEEEISALLHDCASHRSVAQASQARIRYIATEIYIIMSYLFGRSRATV